MCVCVWHGAWLPYSYRLECILWLVASNLMFKPKNGMIIPIPSDFRISFGEAPSSTVGGDLRWSQHWTFFSVPGRSNGKPLLDDEKSMEMNLRSEIYQLFRGDLTAPTWENYRYGSTTFLLELARHGPMEGLQGALQTSIALRMLCQEDGA